MKIEIRPLRECDLDEADRIFRLAFGTFLGMPEPANFAAGVDYIRTRWRAPGHVATFGAFDGGRLVGSNVVTRWGSFGYFGPLTVLPDYWGTGVAQQLLGPTMDMFARGNVRASGLFTFPQSPKHLALYQKHDFWPQHLTAIMAKRVAPGSADANAFSGSRQDLLAGARTVTESIFPGLDLTGEIDLLMDQQLGEIVAICEDGAISAFAICHMGTGSEAGPDTALIKFAAARSGQPAQFSALLAACETAAADRGMGQLMAGVNTACEQAYRVALQQGFRTEFTGVAMQHRNDPGYLAGNALVIGDWR